MPAPVLVIDDNEGDRDQVRRALAPQPGREGREVREAASLEAGLAALEEAAPGVVILDLGLPGVEGVEALEQIAGKAHHRGAAVIVYSQRAPEDWAGECWKKGADGYLQKTDRPLEALRAALVAEIRGAVGRRSYQLAQDGLVPERLGALGSLVGELLVETREARCESREGQAREEELLTRIATSLEARPAPTAEEAPPSGGALARAWGRVAAHQREGAAGLLVAVVLALLTMLAKALGVDLPGGDGGGAAPVAP